jgi:hypothetical protein
LTGSTAGRLNVVGDHGSPTECSGEYNNDQEVVWPIPFANAPLLFAYGLYSHHDTLELMEQTRAICDEDEEIHCWMTGAFTADSLRKWIIYSNNAKPQNVCHFSGIPYVSFKSRTNE